jgi:hypothetical protein
MIARFIAAAALATALIATSAAAQTAEELLQKGIYTQETAGDIDASISIYRQVIGLAGVPKAVAAQAQMQIVSALLQKGDMAGAAEEFGKLARDYADQQRVVSLMARRLSTVAEDGPNLPLGSFENGRYRHYLTGVEFTLPSDWSVRSQQHQASGGDKVNLVDSSIRTAHAFVWIKPVDSSQDEIAGLLLARMQFKIGEQRRAPNGYVDYHLRPDSVQRRTIGGQQAWSAVGDYVSAHGEPMSEYLTFIESAKSRVFFSVVAAAPDFANVQTRFEQVLQTALIP